MKISILTDCITDKNELKFVKLDTKMPTT